MEQRESWWEYKMVQPLRKRVSQFLTGKRVFPVVPDNPTPRYLPRRNNSIRPHKNLHTNVHNSFIHINPKPARTGKFINRTTDKQIGMLIQ